MEQSDKSAKRVKDFLSHSSFKDELGKKEKDQSHKFKKSFVIPKKFSKTFFDSNKNGKKRLPKANVTTKQFPKTSLDQMYCSMNQNYPIGIFYKSNALQRKKIINFSAKERLIALRNIKKLAYEMQQWIYSQIHQKIKVLDQKNQAHLQHFLEKNEERHFRIDRIIKYLSEP